MRPGDDVTDAFATGGTSELDEPDGEGEAAGVRSVGARVVPLPLPLRPEPPASTVYTRQQEAHPINQTHPCQICASPSFLSSFLFYQPRRSIGAIRYKMQSATRVRIRHAPIWRTSWASSPSSPRPDPTLRLPRMRALPTDGGMKFVCKVVWAASAMLERVRPVPTSVAPLRSLQSSKSGKSPPDASRTRSPEQKRIAAKVGLSVLTSRTGSPAPVADRAPSAAPSWEQVRFLDGQERSRASSACASTSENDIPCSANNQMLYRVPSLC